MFVGETGVDRIVKRTVELMGAVTEPGKFANWIAPPGKGIYGQPLDFDYVRFN